MATSLIFAVVLAAAGCSSPDTGNASTSANALSRVKDYVDVTDASLGPAKQTVKQTNGKSWSFDDKTDGRITLLYFGYTSCPDICPTTMADVATALRDLPKKVADRITVHFVSTDPNRDTLDQLRSWLGGFDPDFIGARAPIDQVIKAALAYGTSIEPPKVTEGSYEVTHGAKIYVLQSGGKAVGYFRGNAGPDAYKDALPTLVKEFA